MSIITNKDCFCRKQLIKMYGKINKKEKARLSICLTGLFLFGRLDYLSHHTWVDKASGPCLAITAL